MSFRSNRPWWSNYHSASIYLTYEAEHTHRRERQSKNKKKRLTCIAALPAWHQHTRVQFAQVEEAYAQTLQDARKTWKQSDGHIRDEEEVVSYMVPPPAD